MTSTKRLLRHPAVKQTIVDAQEIDDPRQYKISAIQKRSGSLMVDGFVKEKPILIII